MNPAIVHIVSGASFFSGSAMIAAALGMSFRQRSGLVWRIFQRLLLIAGILLAVLASPALHPVLEAAFFIVPLSVFVADEFISEDRRSLRLGLKVFSLATCLLCVSLEAATWISPQLPDVKQAKVYVVGDSVRAGVGYKGERVWTEIVEKETALPVVNLARGGGTVRSSRTQAMFIKDDAGLIFLEIGGNDMLGGTSLPEFRDGLDALLRELCKPGRTLVMLELPWAPFHGSFRRCQRELTSRYGAALIPRRVFSQVLCGGDSTVDGLHLSNIGHERMAVAFMETCSGLLAIQNEKAGVR